MGYDIHITRTDDWTESENDPITIEEWIAYIDSDPDMQLEGFAEATTSDGGKIRIESPGLAVWITYSKNGQNGNFA
jgi:hypothetical protein